MSQCFVHDDFLLHSDGAKRLYHDYAKPLPIIDYHSHLPPNEIADNRQFENLTQIWLQGDHYKWRAMRATGLNERFITGDASDWEKFEAWARAVPKTLRNPLYHFTHLELRRIFDIADRLLNVETARSIWDDCASKLASPEFSARGLLSRMNVEVLCTTDDPTSDLQYHSAIRADSNVVTKVYPTFRPDRAMAIDNPTAFKSYLDELSSAARLPIERYEDFLAALRQRHDFFHAHGCRLADHGLPMIYADEYNEMKVAACFESLRNGVQLDFVAATEFKSAVLFELAQMNHARGWAQQFHMGVLRNTNSRMLRVSGPDTGFDSIGDSQLAQPLARFLDRLDTNGKLAKTILYNANPSDNEVLATMIGNFQDDTTAGKMQLGAAWWFLDQYDGITRQLDALSNMGLLSQFVGMLTDSRSFLSFARHEYFRRILCNLLGQEMQDGIIPTDFELVGELVRDVCYHNAKRYFSFGDVGELTN